MKYLQDVMPLKKKTGFSGGVKGLSSLMYLKYFNFQSGFVVDYLHAGLLGVIKTHTELLVSAEFKKYWLGMEEDHLGMEHVIAAIDQRLLKLRPPTCISRTPRPVSSRKLWRAHEWRSWLLFYCIPCLKGLLKEEYLLHLCMLSKAINILLQQSITEGDVSEADTLLKCYIFYFQKYFGEKE